MNNEVVTDRVQSGCILYLKEEVNRYQTNPEGGREQTSKRVYQCLYPRHTEEKNGG